MKTMPPAVRNIVRISVLALTSAALTAVVLAQSAADKSGSKVIRGESIFGDNPGTAATAGSVAGDKSPGGNKGFLTVDFDQLAGFEFAAPDTRVTNHVGKVDIADKFIPDSIRALDGKRVLVKGFMLPLKMDKLKATEFLILRNQSTCCFGASPKLNEVLFVKVASKPVEPLMDEPINVLGTLHVGVIREDGYLVGIYRFDCEKLADAQGN